MNTTLVRRLQKLEERFGPSGDDPTSERRRRLAEGLCPDCGLDHPTLPSRGGPWRCSVCGRPFVLQPGPACTQTCPVEGGRGCNARQLGRRRQEQHPEAQRRLDERHARQATEDLTASMAPAHRAILEGWLQARLAEDEPVARPGERVFELLARLEPPALVRAWWALISHHVETNASVSLASDIAEIYLTDPDALPARECEGCRYLLPVRGRLCPDGSVEHLGDYIVTCPICGLKDA